MSDKRQCVRCRIETEKAHRILLNNPLCLVDFCDDCWLAFYYFMNPDQTKDNDNANTQP